MTANDTEAFKGQIATLLAMLDAERRLHRKFSTRLATAEKQLAKFSYIFRLQSFVSKAMHAVSCVLRPRVKPKSPPGCSIIIPTWRPNPYLEKAVESCLKQTMPKKDIEIILCVNGGDKDYLEQLKNQYRNVAQVKFTYTEEANPNIARNLGVEAATMPLLTFLDDDDTLSAGFIERLARLLMKKNVTIAVGRMTGCNEAGEDVSARCNPYIAAMRDLGESPTRNYREASALLSTFWAKLYRASFFKKSFTFPESRISFAEDILFWAVNFPAISGSISCDDWKSGEAYRHRIRPDSRSRIEMGGNFSVILQQWIEFIDMLTKMALDETKSLDWRCFIVSKIQAQEKMLRNILNGLPPAEKKKAVVATAATQNPFLNTLMNIDK